MFNQDTELNFRVIYLCQRCKKEHDRTGKSMFEISVKCSNHKCNGWVITPTGLAMQKIVVDADVFVIVGDKETAWIGAKTTSDAIAFFTDEIDPIYRTHKKLTQEETQHMTLIYDMNDGEGEPDILEMSGRDVLAGAESYPVVLHIISNEELKNFKGDRDIN